MRALVAITALALGACSAMSADVCRSTNWFEIGERDALVYGLRPQITQYAQQCGRHGLQAGETEYLAGC